MNTNNEFTLHLGSDFLNLDPIQRVNRIKSRLKEHNLQLLGMRTRPPWRNNLVSISQCGNNWFPCIYNEKELKLVQK